MTEAEEKAYVRGQRAVWCDLLRQAVRALGADGDAERWRIEREETVAMLRQVCEHHGDNDWPDDLHLADVIDKHLWRHLGSDK